MLNLIKSSWVELRLRAGAFLVRPGDPDDSIFVVARGSLALTVMVTDSFSSSTNRTLLCSLVQDDEMQKEFEVKRLGEGEAILSLLSILDVLTGHSNPLRTVAARALEDSIVVKSGSCPRLYLGF